MASSNVNNSDEKKQKEANEDKEIPKAQQQSEQEEEEEELQDLETSLLALEKLDRASPDLWPDHIPGVSQFVPLATPQDSPAGQSNVVQGLSQEDLATIHKLGGLPVDSLMNEVKRLHDVAYELGIEERKQMVRGKYLNILRKRH